MGILYALEDIHSDLAHLAQFTTSITRQSDGIKQKAFKLQAAGVVDDNATMDGEFFLNRELWDINPTYINYINTFLNTDNITELKNSLSYPFSSTSPSVVGHYFRNWVSVTCETLSYDGTDPTTLGIGSIVNGYELADQDYFLSINNGLLSGIYKVISGTGTVRQTNDYIWHATVRITNGIFNGTAWWNSNLNGKPPAYAAEYIELVEWSSPVGANTYSHAIYGKNYHDLVSNISTNISGVNAYITTFYNAVVALKSLATQNLVAGDLTGILTNIINACDAIQTAKTNLDAYLETIKTDFADFKNLVEYFSDVIPANNNNMFDVREKSFINKPHKVLESMNILEITSKLYNNNFSKYQQDVGSPGGSTGNPSNTGTSSSADMSSAISTGFSSVNDKLAYGNAIQEYWAQVGWQAAERTNNYRMYVELLEQDLIEKNLEEIVEMHDKTVQRIYDDVKNFSTGFLHPVSPKPVDKVNRPERDKDLPWTDKELQEDDPI